MNVKWYISTLIIILAFLGVNQEQISAPNQEIVLQFSDYEMSSVDAQNAVAVITSQLQSIGADNIHVQEERNGKLKITYFSDIDVASVKEVLSNQKSLELGYNSYNNSQGKSPSKKPSDTYNFDVFEIKSSTDFESGFDGYVINNKSENDRFSNPNVFASSNSISVKKKNQIDEVAFVVNRNIAIAIDNISYKIPEVRAGPQIKGRA